MGYRLVSFGSAHPCGSCGFGFTKLLLVRGKQLCNSCAYPKQETVEVPVLVEVPVELTAVPGIGPATAALFESIHITTVEELAMIRDSDLVELAYELDLTTSKVMTLRDAALEILDVRK